MLQHEMYLRAYNSMIHPVPGTHEWVQSGMEAVAPPLYRRPAGRLRKLRRREADELPNSSRVSRMHRTMTCARCLKTGHNARSCKGPVHPDSRLFSSASQPQPASQPRPASHTLPPQRVYACFHPFLIFYF